MTTVLGRLPADQAAELDRYLSAEGITKSEAMRIAIARLLKKPTTRKERDEAKRKPGNPNWTAKPE